jgi:hypothetical protein
VSPSLIGEGLGKACEAELGGAVGLGVGPTLLARYRGDVDDRAAARLTHVGKAALESK